MNLQEAIEQYVDMVTLGSQALHRLIMRQLEQDQRTEAENLLRQIAEDAQKLRSVAARKPGA